jgi:hypothetical protein
LAVRYFSVWLPYHVRFARATWDLIRRMNVDIQPQLPWMYCAMPSDCPTRA